jgi:hypothetical protein
MTQISLAPGLPPAPPRMNPPVARSAVLAGCTLADLARSLLGYGRI